jgi:hypothetical protein
MECSKSKTFSKMFIKKRMTVLFTIKTISTVSETVIFRPFMTFRKRVWDIESDFVSGLEIVGIFKFFKLILWECLGINLETKACNPLRRLAEALGNSSESRALNGCFSSANYYSNC